MNRKQEKVSKHSSIWTFDVTIFRLQLILKFYLTYIYYEFKLNWLDLLIVNNNNINTLYFSVDNFIKIPKTTMRFKIKKIYIDLQKYPLSERNDPLSKKPS